jgi:hypothetical protein
MSLTRIARLEDEKRPLAIFIYSAISISSFLGHFIAQPNSSSIVTVASKGASWPGYVDAGSRSFKGHSLGPTRTLHTSSHTSIYAEWILWRRSATNKAKERPVAWVLPEWEKIKVVGRKLPPDWRRSSTAPSRIYSFSVVL